MVQRSVTRSESSMPRNSAEPPTEKMWFGSEIVRVLPTLLSHTS